MVTDRQAYVLLTGLGVLFTAVYAAFGYFLQAVVCHQPNCGPWGGVAIAGLWPVLAVGLFVIIKDAIAFLLVVYSLPAALFKWPEWDLTVEWKRKVDEPKT